MIKAGARGVISIFPYKHHKLGWKFSKSLIFTGEKNISATFVTDEETKIKL